MQKMLVRACAASALTLSFAAYAATVINAIPGARGFRVSGQLAGDALGSANMYPAGDVNADGFADLVLPAPGADRGAVLNVGATYVILGGATRTANVDISTLNGSNGFKIFSSTNPANDGLGIFVSGVGDINNDNADDLLIGSQAGSTTLGRAYVVFGKPTGGFPASIDLASLGSAGVVLSGEQNLDRFGASSVAGGGDVNGDGIDDFVIGAGGYNGLTGRSYLVFGRNSWPATIAIGAEPASSVVQFNAAATADQFGEYASVGADINNDGRAEIFINAYGADAVGTNAEGKLYVFFGRAAGNAWPASNNAASLNGSDGFTLIGTTSFGALGFPTVSLGDFNGDGIGDFATAAVIGAGTTAIIYGKANWDAVNVLSALNGINGTRFVGQAPGDASGAYLANVGDTNGDGKADLLIGAPGADPAGAANGGKAYLIYGTSAALPADVNLSAVEGTVAGEVFTGPSASFAAGPVSAIGKFNSSDTAPDFVIAAESANGDVYVVDRPAGAAELIFKNGFE
jgi:hypothetical protein